MLRRGVTLKNKKLFRCTGFITTGMKAPKSPREMGCHSAIPFPVSEHCTEWILKNVNDVSALEYFPLLVNSLFLFIWFFFVRLLFNRIIVNVFNFVIIIYESRSTSFSMKKEESAELLWLLKRNVLLCYNFFLSLSPKYQTKPRQKKRKGKKKKKRAVYTVQCFGASEDCIQLFDL